MLWPCKAEERVLDIFQYMYHALPSFKKKHLANLQKHSIESLLHTLFWWWKYKTKVNYWTLWKTLPILLKFGGEYMIYKSGSHICFFFPLNDERFTFIIELLLHKINTVFLGFFFCLITCFIYIIFTAKQDTCCFF